jgi:hypothetical protein
VLLAELPLRQRSITPTGLIEWHRHMLELQAQVVKPHTYMSVWYEWVSNWPLDLVPLYESPRGRAARRADDRQSADHAVGVPAMLWCAWAGSLAAVFARDALAVYLLARKLRGMWIGAP